MDDTTSMAGERAAAVLEDIRQLLAKAHRLIAENEALANTSRRAINEFWARVNGEADTPAGRHLRPIRG